MTRMKAILWVLDQSPVRAQTIPEVVSGPKYGDAAAHNLASGSKKYLDSLPFRPEKTKTRAVHDQSSDESSHVEVDPLEVDHEIPRPRAEKYVVNSKQMKIAKKLFGLPIEHSGQIRWDDLDKVSQASRSRSAC